MIAVETLSWVTPVNACIPYLCFKPEAPRLLNNFALVELGHILTFLTEHSELGVSLVNGEETTFCLCALFVLPLDSSQARSFASMSTLTFGVFSFLADDKMLEMCLDLAAKLTV